MQLILSGADTSGITLTQTEVDFGTTPLYTKTFTIADSNVTSTSKFLGGLAYDAPTGKSLDELDMDQIEVKFGLGQEALGSFNIVVTGLNGYLHDKFKINYVVIN